MTKVRPRPCGACPYRRDVPPGVWAPEEYEKLGTYATTADGEITIAPFGCHASPELLCNGWANVERDSIAMRFLEMREGPIDVPPSNVPLYDTGAEARDAGLAGVTEPDRAARATMARLAAKHPRLRRNP